MAEVTIADVARVAGVSKKTVSRVINDESNVAPQTGELVKKVISDLRYVPNIAARSLSRGKASAIGLVLGRWVQSAYSSVLVDSVLRNATQQGCNLVLFSAGEELSERVITAFLGKQMDGVILDSLAMRDGELIRQLDSLNRPYVVINPNPGDRLEKASTVRIDDFNGARQATEHLISLGHRGIGVLSFPRDSSTTETRLSGYRQALEDAGIPFRPELIWASSSAPAQIGFLGTMELIPNNADVTALFALQDEIAIGAASAVWQLGLRVPGDISLMGFNDTALASALSPPLTTVHQPFDEICRTAVGLVLDMIAGSSEKVDVVLPTTIAVRGTCQPPGRGVRPALDTSNGDNGR